MVKRGICVLAGIALLALAGAYAGGEEFTQVLPQALRFEPVASGGEIAYYKGFDAGGTFVGVVFQASGKGYYGTVDTIAGMGSDGKITAIKVVGIHDTSGVGSKVAESDFIRQFSGCDIPALDGIRPVTGATISSRAVIESVKAKARQIQKLIKQEPR